MWCRQVQMTSGEFVPITQLNGFLELIPISGSFEQSCFSLDVCPEVSDLQTSEKKGADRNRSIAK